MKSHCRVGRVRLKGGAALHQVPRIVRDDVQASIVRAAAKIAGDTKPGQIAGYAVIAWMHDGQYSVGWRMDENAVIGPGLLPAFASDILRREMIESGNWLP